MGARRGRFVRSETRTPNSEPFDESSARIFVRRYSRTIKKIGRPSTRVSYARRDTRCSVPVEGESNDHRKRLAHPTAARTSNPVRMMRPALIDADHGSFSHEWDCGI